MSPCVLICKWNLDEKFRQIRITCLIGPLNSGIFKECSRRGSCQTSPPRGFLARVLLGPGRMGAPPQGHQAHGSHSNRSLLSGLVGVTAGALTKRRRNGHEQQSPGFCPRVEGPARYVTSCREGCILQWMLAPGPGCSEDLQTVFDSSQAPAPQLLGAEGWAGLGLQPCWGTLYQFVALALRRRVQGTLSQCTALDHGVGGDPCHRAVHGHR